MFLGFFAIWTFFYKTYLKGEDIFDKNNFPIADWKKNVHIRKWLYILCFINFFHSRKEAYAKKNSVQVSC